MAPEALNQNDAGKSKRLELTNSVLRDVFGFVVKWNARKVLNL